MPSKYAIGIMSGTSCDGADAVLMCLDNTSLSIIDSESLPYPDDVKNDIQSLSQEPVLVSKLGTLHTRLAQIYAELSNSIINRHGEKHIEVIGCHGQTIYHQPDGQLAFSLQIGNAAYLCEKTQTPVVSDFRSQDIALSGQGAPLVPPFHHALFSQHGPLAVVNIGGIANITYVDKDINKVIGYDCGPGNTLIDMLARDAFNCDYDNKGHHARQGQVHDNLLTDILKDPYFSQPAPKSTGLEYFNADWLNHYLRSNRAHAINQQTLLTTLTHVTANTISNELNRLQIDKAIVCGGGAYNDFLMELIRQQTQCQVDTSADYGISPTHIEAAAFAWLAWLRLHYQPGTLKAVTGATHNAMTGCLYRPSTNR